MSGLKSPAPTIVQLRSSLASLQTALDPVLAQSLEALTTSIEEVNRDGKLQSAQMYVSLAYVVLDLVWILLKVSGVDPASHPVTEDLKRVLEYLQKVHKLSNGKGDEQQEVKDRPAPIDKGKVGRFLRHALGTSAQGKRTVFAEDGSVQKIVIGGDTGKESGEDEEKREQEEGKEKASGEKGPTVSSKAKRNMLKAEKALKKASDAISSSRKKHTK
jgi:exosome complex protein LRP1